MGCFCRDFAEGLQDETEEQPTSTQEAQEDPAAALVSEAGNWLAARWLPAPPWTMDEEWAEHEWPDPPVPPAALGVLLGLVSARHACQDALGVDPAEPAEVSRLTRIVGTLNRRTEALRALDRDARPWEELAALDGQASAVQQAAAQGVFQPRDDPAEQEDVRAWRTLLVKVKALAPLVAIVQLEQLDLTEPEAVDELAETVRALRRVELPPLEDAPLLLRLIARTSAAARLQDSLGVDPRRLPFKRVRETVARRVEAAAKLLPEEAKVQDGRLTGMPLLQPNPSSLLNAPTVEEARKLTPEVLDRLRWQVPPYQDLPLLTVGATVAALVGGLSRLGTNPVRQSPCGRECDAAAVLSAMPALTSRSAGPARPR